MDKVNVPTLDIRQRKVHAQLVPHVNSLPLDQQALDTRLQYANKCSMWGDAGDNRVKRLPNPMAHRNCRQPFRHFPLNLTRGIFLYRAVAGDGRQFMIRIRSSRAGKHRLYESLRDDISEAPIRRRGVRIILHCQSEVTRLWFAWTFQNIFSRPDELDHRQRQVCKMIRVSGPAFEQKIIQSFGIGLWRALFALCNCHMCNPLPPLRSFYHSTPARKRSPQSLTP